ncbi:MAG: ribonucleoside-diphosphate reductase [marine bacterium B5-7]|nr:MAG: ribonucleoside-diphosphate reductase [marine bacterium B5-7]
MSEEIVSTAFASASTTDMAGDMIDPDHPTQQPLADYLVLRRNGAVVPFDVSKISVAITKAFLAVEGGTAAASERIHAQVATVCDRVQTKVARHFPAGTTVKIEYIQDQVQNALMDIKAHKVAESYILYREQRRQARLAEEAQQAEQSQEKALKVTAADGTQRPLDTARLRTVIAEATTGLTEVSEEEIFTQTLSNLYDGVSEKEVAQALTMSARAMVEQNPDYTYAASRLLMDDLRTETLTFLGLAPRATMEEMATIYPTYFRAYIEKGIEYKLLSPELATFDLDKIVNALDSTRDGQFTYLSLQTLYDRYFLHRENNRIELPQAFFMRVAMGLAVEEDDREARAIEFYELLSSFDFMSSTPTLFNAGTLRPQLSSCFLTTIPDDLHGIFGAIQDNAMLSKFAGGVGNDWTPVRSMNSHIVGTNGNSLGVVPFMNVADATAIAVNQGGKRKGAVVGYLETWHLDVEEFLELRKNTGDDRRRTHDMNTANWVPDLFMQRVFEDKEWTLFSPDETPDLHDLYGEAFEKAYVSYEAKAARGQINNYKTLSAVKLWRKMLSMLFETGHPWVTFKDPCNLRSPQQHTGVIHSSNLCTEITLNTSKDEIAVCNLGSINLPAHVTENGLDEAKLAKTTKTAIRMLDNVININYYTVPQAKNSNLQHRPIGLGLMGFQDALYKQKLSYASDAAVDFADLSMEMISYYAIKASSDLAKERGAYDTYKGSLWDQGILPIDSIDAVAKVRGKYLEQNTDTTMDWKTLRKLVKKQGMRNSNVMAIAPTATISNICGVSQSIEPTYQNLFVKSNMSGEFTVINPYLVNELKALNMWDNVMVNDLKYFDGSVQHIDRIPADLKERYATAFEVEPRWLIDAASRRQKWLDQAQSLNIYMAKPSGKKLDVTYRMAWLRGLKTTYYLRSMGATNAEKSTITTGALNAVQSGAPKACSIDDPDCEACQ